MGLHLTTCTSCFTHRNGHQCMGAAAAHRRTCASCPPGTSRGTPSPPPSTCRSPPCTTPASRISSHRSPCWCPCAAYGISAQARATEDCHFHGTSLGPLRFRWKDHLTWHVCVRPIQLLLVFLANLGCHQTRPGLMPAAQRAVLPAQLAQAGDALTLMPMRTNASPKSAWTAQSKAPHASAPGLHAPPSSPS